MIDENEGAEYKNRIEVRLDDQLNTYLNTLCANNKLDKSTVIRFLIRQCAKYNMLDPNWVSEVIENELEVFRNKEDIRVRSETRLFDMQEDRRDANKDKDRSFQIGMKLLDTYLKSMSAEQRRQYIEDRIRQQRAANLDDPMALPVKAESGYSVRINGKEIIVKVLLPDGVPKLEFNQDRLIRCEGGFHTRGSWCSVCDKIGFCALVRDERLGVK